MHIFDGQTLPAGTSTFQLCDITDPLIRTYIEDPVHRTESAHVRKRPHKTLSVANEMSCVTGAQRLVRPRHNGAYPTSGKAQADEIG